MPELPEVYTALQKALDFPDVVNEPRPYLGMSGVGKECLRAQWYSFRWASGNSVYPQRVRRIFERGDLEEERIIKDLRAVGVDVYMMKGEEKLYPKGVRDEFQEEVVHFTGHSKGHIDGRAINVPGAEKTEHLCEFKSMKASKFKDYQKNGFDNFSEYKFQIHMYMGYLKLTRCLYVVTNKDTEERDYKRYEFDINVYEEGLERIMKVLATDVPPIRISDKPDFYKCRFCNERDICFGVEPHNQNCRTCTSGDMHDGGIWKCTKDTTGTPIPVKIQRKGCPQYEALI